MPRIRDFLPGAEPAPAGHPAQAGDDELLGKPAITGDPDLYPISALAAALNRSPVTIRDLERQGVIPKGYCTESDSPNGRRRLYTRQQILMLRQLAGECGVLDNKRATLRGSEFSRLAFLLFDHLRDKAA